MEEQIIEVLKNEFKGQTIDEINKKLNYKSLEGINELQEVLDKMTMDGILHKSKKRDYILMQNTKSLKCGTLRVNRSGNGFVDVSNGPDIFIKSEHLNGAINNDFVEIDFSTHKGNEDAFVIKILKRNLDNLVGEIIKVKNKLIFKADDEKLDLIIKLTKESSRQLVEGHKVLVRTIKQLGKKEYLGEVVKIIGHKNDPGVDIVSIALRHGIEIDFNEAVINELKSIPNSVLPDEKKGRTDLTDELIFTIDGDDTKDIDDAISVSKNNENYILGVHIADVSHYVLMGTALYDAAFSRGTSSYLADTVIPMIPHQLSNGICSLNPGVERLTISCVMTINPSGKVIDYNIFPSVIKSRKQMTYKNVNKILEENIIPEGYEEFSENLKLMQELSSILRSEKESRGYIDFGLDEAKIIQDENGKAIDVVKRDRGVGENLIEDFMIAANETVATHITNMDLPFIYRVHDIPNTEKIEDFKNLIKQMGYQIHTNLSKITPLTMQSILKELKDKKEFSILSDMLLRSMKKAVYSTTNIGHFGLALNNYTHFTSPIRRFPDLTVHRLLRTYLFEKRIDMETINYNQKYLIDVATNSSEREVEAAEAERDVLAMKMAEYMEEHIGEDYIGIISGVTNFGLFVQLDNLIEGLVHISTLDGYYEYIPELLSLVSENKRYRIGDTLKIKVVRASKENSAIDFEIVGDNYGDKE